jgi:hypothetical protein
MKDKIYKIEGYDKDNDVYVKYWEGKDLKVAKVVSEVLNDIANKDELVRYTSDGQKEPIDWVQMSDENDEIVFLNDNEEREDLEM